ncbi:MAG TPA: nidogen-like domain-containing protein, partial [Clostridia bacterium]|nr:nidogen-like domain-containing protein [Clostridia bacterium]
MKSLLALTGAVCLALPTQLSIAQILPGFDSNTLGASDDGSVGPVPIGFTFGLFDQSYDHLFINNNGNVTFDGVLESFVPYSLLEVNAPMLAPFFADVDTRGVGSGVVTYGTGTLDGHRAFGVNWINVGYFSQHTDKLNSFQLVLVEREDLGADNFDFMFNYDQIEWESADS